MKKLLLIIMFLLSASILFAANDEGIELTIYNQNLGLVKDRRQLNLKDGINLLKFEDVAKLIDATSVHFKSITAPDKCSILEQNYEYDLASVEKILNKYLDKEIKLITDKNEFSGKLISYDSQNVVILDSKTNFLNMVSRSDNIRNINFSELPEGLITKPTLVWEINCDKPGFHLCEVSYLTSGINWYVDYVVVLDKDDKTLDLNGWVTIDNRSGATYKDTNIKLIAGEIHRAEEQRIPYAAMKEDRKGGEGGFVEKAFFEYHMYTLQRKTTVKDNQTKQISLLMSSNIPCKKIFIFDPVGKNYWNLYSGDTNSTKERKVGVSIELLNSKANNLGMPLPKGKVRIYKKDTDNSLQLVGEDNIDHTPKDEKIKLEIGEAFDLVGERNRIDFKEDKHSMEETYEITLRNHKEEPVEIIVLEHFWRYSNWKILQSTQEFTKKDAQSGEFKVKVEKDKEAKVTYTVRYWW